MEITVTRKQFNVKATIGEMQINGAHECYTLEDRDRGMDSSEPLEQTKAKKIYGETAIPIGRYAVEKVWWEKHKRFVPHIKNVPAFEGILIHSGNTDKDTEGCVLVGLETAGNDFIGKTVEARMALEPKIFEALSRGEEVWITVERDNDAWFKFYSPEPV